MTVHQFPNDGERLWRSIEPRVRDWLVANTAPAIADEVLPRFATVVRKIGDSWDMNQEQDVPRERVLEVVNTWASDRVFGVLQELMLREIELHKLRAERDRLLAQLRSPRPV